MKILYLITGLEVGGAERLVTSYADNFVNQGHKITLVYLSGEAKMYPADERVKLICLNLKKNPISFLLALFRFNQIVKEFQPDVVNSHMFHANIFARVSKIFTSIKKLISSSHNTYEGGRLRCFIYRLTDFLTDISTNVSNEAVTTFIKSGAVKPGRMITIHNSIDTDSFDFSSSARLNIRKNLGVDSSILLFLAVGSLTKQKDYPNLLYAFKQIIEGNRSAKLIVAGEGEEQKSIIALIEKLGLQTSVILLGNRHDIPELMSACDIFVLSSAWEGFGLVVAEAMSCQRVVVATDSGGVREVLGDEGFIIQPRNSEQLYSSMLAASQLTGGQITELGKRARIRVLEFYSIQVALNKWENLFQDIQSCKLSG